MVWGWPQIVVVSILLLGTGLHLGKHGEPKNDKYNVWGALINDALMIWLLYEGGFWAGVAQ